MRMSCVYRSYLEHVEAYKDAENKFMLGNGGPAFA